MKTSDNKPRPIENAQTERPSVVLKVLTCRLVALRYELYPQRGNQC